MNRAAICLAALVCAVGASVCRGEEPTIEELKKRLSVPVPSWKDLPTGTWVQTASETGTWPDKKRTETRQTVKSRDEESVTIETQVVTRKKGEDGKEIVELGEATSTTIPKKFMAEVTLVSLKVAGHEDLEIGKKTLTCQVVLATYSTRSLPFLPPVLTMKKMWISGEVKENFGIVKMTMDPPAPQARLFGVGTMEYTYIESREIKFGDRTFACAVYHVNNDVGPGGKSSGEALLCPQVPNGCFKSRLTGKSAAPGSEVSSDVSLEITDLHLPVQEEH